MHSAAELWLRKATLSPATLSPQLTKAEGERLLSWGKRARPGTIADPYSHVMRRLVAYAPSLTGNSFSHMEHSHAFYILADRFLSHRLSQSVRSKVRLEYYRSNFSPIRDLTFELLEEIKSLMTERRGSSEAVKYGTIRTRLEGFIEEAFLLYKNLGHSQFLTQEHFLSFTACGDRNIPTIATADFLQSLYRARDAVFYGSGTVETYLATHEAIRQDPYYENQMRQAMTFEERAMNDSAIAGLTSQLEVQCMLASTVGGAD